MGELDVQAIPGQLCPGPSAVGLRREVMPLPAAPRPSAFRRYTAVWEVGWTCLEGLQGREVPCAQTTSEWLGWEGGEESAKASGSEDGWM